MHSACRVKNPVQDLERWGVWYRLARQESATLKILLAVGYCPTEYRLGNISIFFVTAMHVTLL